MKILIHRSEEDKKIRKGQVVVAYEEIMKRKDLSKSDRQFILNSLTDVVAQDKQDEMDLEK